MIMRWWVRSNNLSPEHTGIHPYKTFIVIGSSNLWTRKHHRPGWFNWKNACIHHRSKNGIVIHDVERYK